MRPCISLSCCVTFLRATYAFKCCSQSLPAARGARVRNPSVPGKVAQKNQPRDRAGRKLQPNQLCTRPACQHVRYFARRAARCAQEPALQDPEQCPCDSASAAGPRPELCTSLTISLSLVDSLVATPLPCCACSIAFCVVRFSITAVAAATASEVASGEWSTENEGVGREMRDKGPEVA